MIVKKPWRRVKCSQWNKKTKNFDWVEVTDYIGYFILGFIPLF